MKKVHHNGFVSFYRVRGGVRYVIHFTDLQYACRKATAKRLAAFRRNCS
jgi:hypothetical protein